MRELSLFTGAGGGIYGSKLLGWTTKGYVEKDERCQEVIRQRIDDGIFDDAPIFRDVQTFIYEGWTRVYQGMVDVISAGFPCQPFSLQGKRRASFDDKNLWPETIRIIAEVRPQWVILENVRGLLSGTHGYFGTVLKGLAESGYNARWDCFSASEVGAPHHRERVWIVARRKDVADPQSQGGLRLPDSQGSQVSHAPRSSESPGWWTLEPRICRVVNGMADRKHRITALGNGQVPLCFASAFTILAQELEKSAA